MKLPLAFIRINEHPARKYIRYYYLSNHTDMYAFYGTFKKLLKDMFSGITHGKTYSVIPVKNESFQFSFRRFLYAFHQKNIQ